VIRQRVSALKKLGDELAAALKTFPSPRPLRLMFQDEARFGRISDCRYCWAKFPQRPMVKAMLTHQYVYAYGAVSIPDGHFDSLVLPHVNGDCMGLFLAEIAERYPADNIVMVLDGAGWHKNQSMPIPDNIRLLSLPPYSPELNPVEHLWDELREKHFHNRAFDSLDALEGHLVDGLLTLERDLQRNQSICNWTWIINALCIAN
jgi:transposase